ncbi:MAG TPA: DUF6167 family protein [Propionibacteriaceae bacterium]|nr:DUF6167 family protein [Propionibacteriaceae bacterium]HPZ49769.1 DUF6167 family protein [Propionibacteriaceae bacterium]
MKRTLWFAAGVAVAVVVVWQGQKLYRKFTPQGMQEQAADLTDDLGKRFRTFTTTLTEAMNERETELREALGITDVPPAEFVPVQARRAARA